MKIYSEYRKKSKPAKEESEKKRKLEERNK
jgi:hypothetical protein